MNCVSMRTIIVFSLKCLISVSTGFAVYSLLRGLYDSLPYRMLVVSVAVGSFLAVVMIFNAGLLVNSLGRTAKRLGVAGAAVSLIEKCARYVLVAREKSRVQWFRWTLMASIAVNNREANKRSRVLVIPADTAKIEGSLGDQALLVGLGALRHVSELTYVVSESCSNSSMFSSGRFLHAWEGVGAGWRLGKAIREAKELFVIGADVMDGYYSSAVSRQRIIVAQAFSSAGLPCSIVSFSFNERPSPDVVREFQELNQSVRLCLRDAVSLERFERLVGRKAILVADLAFLMAPVEQSEVVNFVKPWVEREQDTGRKILAVNVNPQVVAHLTSDAERAIAHSLAQACDGLVKSGVSVVLVPHDFRHNCADLRVMQLVWNAMSLTAQEHSLLIVNTFTAQEIKAVCRLFDMVFSARMHLAIGALAMEIPVCGMQYQGKFEGLFMHFEFGADIFISPEDALDPKRLADFLSNQLEQALRYREQIRYRLPVVREMAKLNAGAPA